MSSFMIVLAAPSPIVLAVNGQVQTEPSQRGKQNMSRCCQKLKPRPFQLALIRCAYIAVIAPSSARYMSQDR